MTLCFATFFVVVQCVRNTHVVMDPDCPSRQQERCEKSMEVVPFVFPESHKGRIEHETHTDVR